MSRHRREVISAGPNGALPPKSLMREKAFDTFENRSLEIKWFIKVPVDKYSLLQSKYQLDANKLLGHQMKYFDRGDREFVSSSRRDRELKESVICPWKSDVATMIIHRGYTEESGTTQESMIPRGVLVVGCTICSSSCHLYQLMDKKDRRIDSRRDTGKRMFAKAVLGAWKELIDVLPPPKEPKEFIREKSSMRWSLFVGKEKKQERKADVSGRD
ncbi:hypothetical protein P280DRAFT_513982 [Massarina eburnea CBS 473.64]|uniref:Uncharacterized protein n=1 Tax=Massarina eburnea CBS 473.64 TaxID=1395130 RepID=A0A6A6S9T4_9PLEO|nr:hypothetical protein P280DRAFT_513982 [Massarina eburnea CBS 473.64]